MEPIMPSSRSNSSIGFPGEYGVMPAIVGLIRIAMVELCMRRIRSKDLEEQAAGLDLSQGPLHAVFFDMPFQIDEENILPCLSARGTGFDFGEIRAMGRERTKQIVQGTNLVLDGQHDGGLVLAGALRGLGGQD